jgi:hypothetical protein
LRAPQEKEGRAAHVEAVRAKVSKAEERCKELVRERDACNDERKEAWRGGDEAEAALRKIKDRLRACESQVCILLVGSMAGWMAGAHPSPSHPQHGSPRRPAVLGAQHDT